MKIEQELHMMGGCGETSYANNSELQGKIIFKMKPMMEKAISEILDTLLPEKFVVADLGCSSGPNTIILMSVIVNLIDEHCLRFNLNKPEIQFFLNDLPSNDFNNLFRLSGLYEKQVKEEKGDEFAPYYVVGLPGSFYGRLFPSNSVHLFQSNYCLMWLSQVPKGFEGEENAHLNKGNIYINEKSSNLVSQLYLEQFRRDFFAFLKSRSKELIRGGRMLLSFLGRTNFSSIGGCLYLWKLLSEALNDMISEGLVEEAKLNAFNLPFYEPLMEDVKSIIEIEGSFHLIQAQNYEPNWDPFDDSTDNVIVDKRKSGENVSKYMRSIMEPLLTSHFGNQLMDDLFMRYANNIARHMSNGKPRYVVHILVLMLKDEATNKNYEEVC